MCHPFVQTLTRSYPRSFNPIKRISSCFSFDAIFFTSFFHSSFSFRDTFHWIFSSKKFLCKASLSFSVKVVSLKFYISWNWTGWSEYRITTSSNRLFFSTKIERRERVEKMVGTKARKYLKEGRKGVGKRIDQRPLNGRGRNFS